MKKPCYCRMDAAPHGDGEHNDDRAGSRVCVITYPFDDDVGRHQLSNLLSVFKSLGMKTLVISGESGPVNTEMNPIRIRPLKPGSMISRDSEFTAVGLVRTTRTRNCLWIVASALATSSSSILII